MHSVVLLNVRLNINEKLMEKELSRNAYINKLERLIESLKNGKSYTIQIKGKRIRVPADAQISVEYEKDDQKELEFQIKW